ARLALHDPAAANNLVAVVEDGRLAGCDGSLRFIEYDAGSIVRQGVDGRRCGFVAVADLDLCTNRLRRLIKCYPVDTFGGELDRLEIVCLADDDLVFGP